MANSSASIALDKLGLACPADEMSADALNALWKSRPSPTEDPRAAREHIDMLWEIIFRFRSCKMRIDHPEYYVLTPAL